MQGSESINQEEHIGVDKTGDNISAKRVAVYAWDDATSQWVRVSYSQGNLVTETFDYIAASYPAADTETYTYKTGGSGGTTVATITVVYTDSTKENISTITRT